MTQAPRRKATRLPGFEYPSSGAYFVTLVTKNRECLFGEIIGEEMVFSDFGRIVAEEWERSAVIRAEIELGEYAVMPNHFHGIVHIFKDDYCRGDGLEYSNIGNRLCNHMGNTIN